MKKFFVRLIILLVLAGAVWGSFQLYGKLFKKQVKVVYVSALVRKGDMRNLISATGTVEPEELVNVGAQVGGMVESFGTDADGKLVDYGSPVKAGMILAKIDSALYAAEAKGARAKVMEAEANIRISKANQEQTAAKLKLATLNKVRAEQLFARGALAKSEYDACMSEYANAKAANDLSDASLAQAKAQLESAAASQMKADRNLGYCTIQSPVNGVIIDRRVNIGQTVNSSMNAPSLFLIAKDLRKMQVWVSVNEADIGQIKAGGKAEFGIDTFPGEVFKGTVRKVRLNATMSQNVVTYVVEITTDNSSGRLLPYLTANVNFVLAERFNVMQVSNAAFRFSPPPESNVNTDVTAGQGERLVWILKNGKPEPRKIKVGLNDGRFNEVLSGLEEGDRVITGASVDCSGKTSSPSFAGNDGGSPFLPRPPRRQNTKPGAAK